MDPLSETLGDRLWLSTEQWEQMRSDVERRDPEEACGLVLGRGGRAVKVIPVTNALHSPVRFRMEPQDQLKAFLEMERQNHELIAIYHSHPMGPVHPSPTDIAEAYYPEAAMLIWSRLDGEWTCSGFRIYEGRFSPIPLLVENEE